MHHIDRDTPWDEIWQAMEVLVAQGKIIYVGSSNFAGWDIARANETAKARGFGGLVSEQSLYNLVSRHVELEVLPAAKAYGVGLIPWSPLGGGLLGGVLKSEREGRRRINGRAKLTIEANRDKFVAYEDLCEKLGEEPADVALAWLLHQDGVTAPIIGPRTLAQFDGAQRALEISLDADVLRPAGRDLPRLQARAGALRLVSAQAPAAPALLRDRSGNQRVTNIELFFDLVYVFAVTQLSHYLLHQPTVGGAFQTAILLALVWLAWAYTTWVTNWLDPDRLLVRLLLVALMLVSLAMSVALPRAFGGRGACGWAARTRSCRSGAPPSWSRCCRRGTLRRNYERILVWCIVSGALAVGGGLAHGHARELLWLLAIGVDVLGGILGFEVPGLGRSRTSDWTIEGGHFAERCQAFILIALGESIVIIGATLSDGRARLGDRDRRVRGRVRRLGRAVVAVLRPVGRRQRRDHRSARTTPAGSAGPPTISSTR